MFTLKKKLNDAKNGMKEDAVFLNKWLYQTFYGMAARYETLLKVSARQKNRFKLLKISRDHGEQEVAFSVNRFGTGYELLIYARQLGAGTVTFEAADGYVYEFCFYGPFAYLERYKYGRRIKGPVKIDNPFFFFEPEAIKASERASQGAAAQWYEDIKQQILKLTNDLNAAGAPFEDGQPLPKHIKDKMERRAKLAGILVQERRKQIEKDKADRGTVEK